MANPPVSISARLFNIPETNLQPVREGHVSQVYGFARDRGDYILRLTPPEADIDLPAQKATMAWMALLAQMGACVPNPIPSINGNSIETILHEEGNWLAVVKTKAVGILSEELPLEQLNARLFEALVLTVGRMHSAARNYVPAEEMSRPDWEQSDNPYHLCGFAEPWVEGKAADLLEKIHILPKSPESYGMIHADLYFGNFFVDIPSNTITIFDFDDISRGWFVMDLAILLFHALVLYNWPDLDAFALEFLQPLLHGYYEGNNLDPFWLAQIPLFTKLLEINIYGKMGSGYTKGSDWRLDKFMPGRMERIRNNIPYV